MGSGPWRRPLRSGGSPHERQADAIAAQVMQGGQSTASEAASHTGMPRRLASRLASATGYDFSALRIHADAESGGRARQLGARAFTVGRDVYVRPGLKSGEHEAVLAHEAIHAAQQGSAPRTTLWGSPPASLWPSAANVPQFTPGVDADDSWSGLVKEEAVIPDEPEIRARGVGAKSRFLRATEGKRLINSLWRLSNQGQTSPRFDLGIAYRTELPHDVDDLKASGWFQPRLRAARHYTIHVKDSRPPMAGVRRLPGAKTGEGVPFTHVDPESDMAATLHHELEHVEFMRTGAGKRWETGHGDVEKGEVEEGFRDRIRAFEGDLDGIERRMHEEADAQRNAPSPPSQAPDLDARTPERAASKPSGPPLVGLRVSADAGLAGQGGRRFTGVAGADLVLGRLSSLNLGVRGIYLTPDRLLAGGTIGAHFAQPSESALGGAVENPLFFDIEAGVVGQLKSSERSRVLDKVGLFGSAAIGQEYGTSGNRFFWRLGGYVIVSDQGPVSGGVTGGLGVRFQ